jgi:hypothetical protein
MTRQSAAGACLPRQAQVMSIAFNRSVFQLLLRTRQPSKSMEMRDFIGAGRTHPGRSFIDPL